VSTAHHPGGQVILLASTHRVAPGLLRWPAWQALHAADAVLIGDEAHPQLPYLREAGVRVRVLDTTAGDTRWLARRLLTAAPGGSTVWVSGADGDPGLGDALARELAARAAAGLTAPRIEALPGAYDLPGARLLDLVAVMDRLRSPGGCPWDREQTHASLVKYLLEEAYETVETIEAGAGADGERLDRDALREELGDVLLQVAFHSRIAEEHPERPWSIDDVAAGIVDKLVRRHPHVFADTHAPTAGHVEANWERIKAAEKGRTSVVQGVPLAQPALSLAAKLLSRASRADLDLDLPAPAAIAPPEQPSAAAVGATLLAVVCYAVEHDIDAEAALRAAARGLREQIIASEGR
jgi:XTP/dITP diphosphohydrolase